MEAKYTVTLYELLENEQTKELIDKALSTYPLYESQSEHKYGIPNIVPTREQLNKKICDYYKYREIGFETVGRFLDELEIAMKEIMPKYNQILFSTDQDYDIKFNVDYKRQIDRDRNEDRTDRRNSTDTSESTGNNTATTTESTNTTANVENYNKQVHSETPQGEIGTANTGIDNVQYADDIKWNKDNNSETGTSTGTSSSQSNSTLNGTTQNETESSGDTKEKETTEERTFGNYGATSTQTLISQYRDLIVNVEQEIINDPRIQELFMLVY